MKITDKNIDGGKSFDWGELLRNPFWVIMTRFVTLPFVLHYLSS